MNQNFDIVIIGAGIVGCTLACALAQARSLKIALIDKNPAIPEIEHLGYDSRVSTITPASEKLFNTIGAWDRMLSKRANPFKKMFVWDSNSAAHIEFNALDLGELRLGHLIENRAIQSALLETMRKYPNITLLQNSEPESIFENLVELKDGTTLQAQLIIGADGAKSFVREQVNIDWQTKDYQHTAIVCTVKTEKSHEQTAWQCFTPQGPIALLPFSDEHHCSLVWSSSPEQAKQLMSMNEGEFQTALAQHFEHKLGVILEVSPRHSFSLIGAQAKQYVKNNIVLVGDAAHTIHPLAGQGLNLGLMDAALLAELITTAIMQHKPWDTTSLLKQYERERKSENWLMMQTMEQLKNLFGSQNTVVKRLRQTGLDLTNNLGFIKNKLARKAMGLS